MTVNTSPSALGGIAVGCRDQNPSAWSMTGVASSGLMDAGCSITLFVTGDA